MHMGSGCNARFVFPLTSLQIGDLQSYLSHLSLFMAPESKKLYILVDNRPWLKDLVSRPAHLWQLMVTKSRMSPFANTRRQKEKKETEELFEMNNTPKLNRSTSKQIKKWFSVIDAASLSRKRALLPVKKLRTSLILNSKLHRTLYGFIVFEVAWSDVRGINYLNELQTDTSLAIEAKFMKRWEFDSIRQAAKYINSWFSGTLAERFCLIKHLESTIGDVYYDAQDAFPGTTNVDDAEYILHHSLPAEDGSPCSPYCSFSISPATVDNRTSLSPQTPPPQDGPYKRRKLSTPTSSGLEIDMYSEETYSESVDSPIVPQTPYASDCEEAFEATPYRDVLLLFRFDDRVLPFKLKEIIMSDLRLLTLLESGLPSWVIFLQSYPGFSHIYRPWMCPLARALYVLISIVTVLIGFYDLYKNVPVLKATASHFCGPLLDWIETWEMVSRIKYLGTMLFLHNFKKALEWFFTAMRTIRSFLRVLTHPMTEPVMEFWQLFLPFWNMFIMIGESFFSAICIVAESFLNLMEFLTETILSPLWFILSIILTIATSIVCPICWILWEILYAPFRLVLGISSLLVFIFSNTYDLVGDVCLFLSSIFQFTSSAEATVSSYEVSIWRTLWNDLFSQIFRAVRSILNGFVAFFTACNRHRLSIYNHVLDFIQRLSFPSQRSHCTESSRTRQIAKTPDLIEGKGESKHKMKYHKQR